MSRFVSAGDADSDSTPNQFGYVATIVAMGFAVRICFLFFTANTGTDAWARYLIAGKWLSDPSHIPSKVWLPFHFWLLGVSLYLWHSEWAARILTLILGGLTLLPYWGIVRRLFDEDVATYSLLTFAFFGLHIGYSVTTSSEAPTIFFLALGLYGWLRFTSEDRLAWLLLSGLSLSAACLCRYEPWVQVVILAAVTLSLGTPDPVSRRVRWRQAGQFLVCSGGGAVGWSIFSYLKWGSPLASAQRTVALNAAAAQISDHPLLYRASVSPGVLLISLSPVLFVLAVVGLIITLRHRGSPQFAIAVFVILSAGTQWYNAMVYRVEMARYTLMYSWLLIPFAFLGLRTFISLEKWRPRVFAGVFAFFLAWQAGVIVGAEYAPCQIANTLGSVSATLPLRCNFRHLLKWLRSNPHSRGAVVIDNYEYETKDLIRFSDLASAKYLLIPDNSEPQAMERELTSFVDQYKPRTLIYCTEGELGRTWHLGAAENVSVADLGLHLHRIWQEQRYRVYELEYDSAK